MSVKSQEKNMRRLADLLSRDLSYIWGERESGPNGDKKVFLSTGKTFLRALAKDLELCSAEVHVTPGGIAVSGECSLIGMWESSGIYVQISQSCGDRERVLLYRTVKSVNDHTGGRNIYLNCGELERLSYGQLLDRLLALRKEAMSYERAA